jgi:pimeloyl-ACP methyl ester carboxylesterase
LSSFDPVVAKLRHRFRIIRYDVPGQGLSGPVSDAAAHRFSPAEIPELLLSNLGLKDVTLLGVSSGGTLCVYLAARRPDLVKRLILSNMPADPVDTSHLKQPDSFIEAQRQARESGFQSEQFWDQFLSFFFGDARRITPSIRQQFYDVNRRVPDHNALSLVAKVADHSQAVAMMDQVTAPTLLLWGASDPLLPISAARILEGYLTKAPVSMMILPDVGHFPPIEVPDRFADIVASYIDDVTP